MSDNTDKPRPTRIESLLASLFVAAVMFIIGGCTAEAIARFYVTHGPEDRFLLYASERQLEARYGQGSSKFAPHPYLGVIPRPGWSRGTNRHNSLGFRGDEFPVVKPAGEFRIVCLGGSTTYTSAVEDYRRSYPAQLGEQLRRSRPHIRVVNGGTPDWTSWETLISFQTRVLDLSPDLVIVYHAINDLEARIVWPPEAYRGDNSGSRTVSHRDVTMPGILEYSTLMRYVLVRTGRTQPHARLERVLVRPETSLLRNLRRQLREGTYPTGRFSELPLEDILRANEPRYFRRNLEHLIATARLRDVEVVLVTMTTAPAAAGLVFASAQDIMGIGEMNEVTRAVASEYDVPLLDLARTFPADVRLFHDGVHVNEAGAAVRAQLVREFLEASDLLPD